MYVYLCVCMGKVDLARDKWQSGLQAAINPVSTTGRQLSHLLHYLHTSLGAHVEVILNPVMEVESMPLNAFYAFASPPLNLSTALATTKAELIDVPGNMVLTMSLEVPEAWLVEVCSMAVSQRLSTRSLILFCSVLWSCHKIPLPSLLFRECNQQDVPVDLHSTNVLCACIHNTLLSVCNDSCYATAEREHTLQVVSAELDTDNLKLDDLGDVEGIQIGVELEAIMLTGSCIDTAFEKTEELHPGGVQLLLQDSQSRPLQDTVVMRNLGYFQLKTAPGLALISCLSTLPFMYPVRRCHTCLPSSYRHSNCNALDGFVQRAPACLASADVYLASGMAHCGTQH
jgi:hypothetical protein